MRMLRFGFLWIAALCAACAPLVRGPDPWREWRSVHDVEHPLAGRILDVRSAREISPRELVDRLASARFALLGEKHDNPDHHRLQAWLIERLAARGQRRSVAFEMLGVDAAPALAEQLERAPTDVDGIARAARWDESGWPEWSLYRPVFAAALAAGYPLLAADLSAAERQRLRSGGRPADALIALGVEEPLPPEALAALESDLERSHCGMLPASALPKMIAIQRARDAQLAATLLRADAPDGAILIAGAGHVARNAVPNYLAHERPVDEIATLALTEVDPQRINPHDYLETPYDFLWLTPRVDDQNPCDRFKDQLENLNQKHNTN